MGGGILHPPKVHHLLFSRIQNYAEIGFSTAAITLSLPAYTPTHHCGRLGLPQF